MSTLTYLGHACFLFETEKAACLIDPWLSKKGAFLGTWRQLPPNSHCLPWVIEKMKQKPVIIYVTHEHEDHFDQETLKTLLPYCKGLYIPAFKDSFLQREIENNLGAAPHLLQENVPQEFFDISFKIFRDESGIEWDSAIFLKSKDLSFLDLNDCKIYDRASWLRETCGPIDVFSCQYSGANQHPITYEFSEEAYRKISHQKRMRKFVAIRQFLDTLKPSYFLPSAGPALFSMPEHVNLNFEKHNIFPKWWEFKEYLESKSVPVVFKALDVGGSVIAEHNMPFRFDGLAEKISDDDVRNIINMYREFDAADPQPKTPDPDKVIAFFEREISAKLEVLKNHPAVRIRCPVFFEIRIRPQRFVYYRMDPVHCTLELSSKNAVTEPYYIHKTDIESLGRLMQSGKSWGTYFLSFQYKNDRVPDLYDSALAIFLFSNDRYDLDFALKKLTDFQKNEETVTLISPDKRRMVTCKRYCPHQGGDLAYARFDGRYVICPRHQWRFDCENGGKCDKSPDSICATISKLGAENINVEKKKNKG